MTFYTKIKAAAFAAGISLASIAFPAMADEQYFPYRATALGHMQRAARAFSVVSSIISISSISGTAVSTASS